MAGGEDDGPPIMATMMAGALLVLDDEDRVQRCRASRHGRCPQSETLENWSGTMHVVHADEVLTPRHPLNACREMDGD